MSRRIVVIGGGIAGLSSAWALGIRGAGEIIVLEAEPHFFAAASGSNAAIYRALESDPWLVRLALRSRRLAEPLMDLPLVDERGLLLIAADDGSLDAISAQATASGVSPQWLEPRELSAMLGGPALAARRGLLDPTAGVIDTHELGQALLRRARALGVQVRTSAVAAGLERDATRVTGVLLTNGDRVPADSVVLASGAWCGDLAAECGCPLELTPRRRHLAVLDDPDGVAPAPVVWSLTDDVYFRREGNGVLTSPCDEVPFHACIPPAELDALAPLAGKLEALAPRVSALGLRRFWACLRTFSRDERPVIGADPRLDGLYWLAGLGGFGMTAGVAAGELLARSVCASEEEPELSPARYTSRQ